MEFRPTLLLLDRAPSWDVLDGLAWEVERVASLEGSSQALRRLGHERVRAVVARVNELSASDLELIEVVHGECPDVPILFVASKASVSDVTELMRAGAFDCLTEPLGTEDLSEALRRTVSYRSLGEAFATADSEDRIAEILDVQVGASPAMHHLFALIRKIAPRRSTVLILGETGSGKEVVARSIHFLGPRASKPFVAVNVAALPAELVEAELFGHERGAFTGAHKSRRGAFEQASGGTLFLDEIGDLPAAAQPKLLRVLDEQAVKPLGSEKVVPLDVRLVAATHRNLADEVAAGRFREDLYFRLNVIPIEVPPLRDHKQDIRPLANFFVRKHSARPGRSISEEALEQLTLYRWRGNVRELENAIERALAFSENDRLGAQDFDFLESHVNPLIADSLIPGAIQQQLSLRQLDELYIDQVLEWKKGDRGEAARVLGIDRRTLSRRLSDRA